MLRITLVLFIVGGTVAQIEFRKSCPSPNTVQNFDVKWYMGKWYEFAKYTSKSSIEDKCVTATHSLYKKGSFEMINTQTPLKGGETYSYKNPVVPINKFRNGKFTITVGGTPYWVLDTDYTNWATVWSCTNSGDNSIVIAWIYTRARNPAKWVIKAAYKVFRVNNVELKYFVLTNKTGCPDCY